MAGLVCFSGGETTSTSLLLSVSLCCVSMVCSALDLLSFCGVETGVGWVTCAGDVVLVSDTWLC